MLLMALMLPGMLRTGGGTNDVGFFFLRFVALLKIQIVANKVRHRNYFPNSLRGIRESAVENSFQVLVGRRMVVSLPFGVTITSVLVEASLLLLVEGDGVLKHV